jgi:hypothetical protein
MKRNIFFYLSLVFVAFTTVACNLENVMSPGVQYSSVLYRTYTVQDSLGVDSVVCDTITLNDSLQVGDTVRFPMVLNGYYDYITSFVCSADTSKVHVSLMWDEEYNSFLSADADPAGGILAFNPGSVYRFVTTLVYVPVASGTHRIDMELNSAAKAPYSQWAAHFFIGVK